MKTVFFDVDTQIDFLFPAGALYVPGAEKLLPTLARLNRYAVAHGVLVSDVDAHAEDDPEFNAWPPHCIQGTQGQRKPAELLCGQVILEKQTLDVFENPALPPLLAELNAEAYVVYGVVTEICVAYALRGLLRTGKPVTLVTDAIQCLDPAAAARTLAEFRAAGGRLATAASIMPV